jgi:glutamate-ammonia-ligase adenylyltransferase
MTNLDKPISAHIEQQSGKLPAPLRDPLKQQLDSFFETFAINDIPADLADDIAKVWACSEFVSRWCQRVPEQFSQLIQSGDLLRRYEPSTYTDKLREALKETKDQHALKQILRLQRQREMVRIAWRDISGRADLQEVLADLSNLADACIQQTLIKLHNHLTEEWGQPVNAAGEAQSLIIIALGKLGGQELNFSSDIDLMFVYPEEGETTGDSRTRTNAEFFIRLGQQFINALDENTADGIVFRVDMRLRPFGQSGALAMNFDSLEHYYQTHGREWERYALVKARLLTGDETAKQQLRDILRPFIFRRYLDFNVYESLRKMKQMIVTEVKRKKINHNVKLGAGGIREIEFISQTVQLIRGGREPALQNPHLLPTLDQLTELQHLPEHVTGELKQAYIFLRNTEHRIQEYADQQTHNLPDDPTAQSRLAFSMGFENWEAFSNELEKYRQQVRNHFDQMFVAPQTETTKSDDSDIANVWESLANEAESTEALEKAGYEDAQAALRQLTSLNQSYQYRSLATNGRRQFQQLMPLLIAAIGQNVQPDKTLPRIIKLLERIAQRTTYLALLLENPMALSQLVKLCAASTWIADLLSKHPVLLDELLDPRTLYQPPDKDALDYELAGFLAHVAEDDLETQMETLRQFKQANVLRVAAADIVNAIPLMKVSDHLTWIAETLLTQVFEIVWREMVNRHGTPPCEIDGQATEPGFIVIAYGKLGGIELGYGSDLDLVFLHSSKDDHGSTSGPKPVANAVFFARLGQRIIHLINTLTPSGVLYEVDMRLRPSGASGMLVSHIDAFADYQLNKAWTWEHQALVRARVVAGDPQLAQAFANIRQKTLSQKRDTEKLKQDVVEMRERMRESNEQRGKKDEMRVFDLKQAKGGIADIEFMVQYGVLAWSHDQPELLEFSDNINLLECFGRTERLSHNDASLLIEAYRHYRNTAHKQTLLGEPAVVDIKTQFAGEGTTLDEYRQQVIIIWEKLLVN